MIKKFHHEDIVWLDIEKPKPEELKKLAKEYHLSPSVVSDLSHLSPSSKAEIFHHYLFLIFHFPQFEKEINLKTEKLPTQEIDFIIGRNFLLTFHYEKIEPLEELGKILEASLHNIPSDKTHAGYLFSNIIRQLYQAWENDLNDVKELIDIAKNDNQLNLIEALSVINYRLADFELTLKNHHEALNALESSTFSFFDEKFSFQTRLIADNYDRLQFKLKNLKELITNENQTQKMLIALETKSVLEKIFLILIFLGPIILWLLIFSLNVKLPLGANRIDWWLILLSIIGIISIVFKYAKNKKWL